MPSNRRTYNLVYRLRDNGIAVDMQHCGDHDEYSIQGSPYMTQKQVNPYLRNVLHIDPATLLPRIEYRKDGSAA